MDPELQKIIDAEIRRHPEIKLGILYGSLEQGTHRLDSDVDLAVAKDHREPLDEETFLQLSLEAGLPLWFTRGGVASQSGVRHRSCHGRQGSGGGELR